MPQHPLLDECVHDSDQEQRIPRGALMQEPGESLREGSASEALGQIAHDRALLKIAQGQFLRVVVHLEFLHYGAHRVGAHRRLDRPVCPQDQQTGRGTALRYIRQPLQRGTITPVQIFEHQDEWAVGTQRLHRLGEFPQHALPGGATAALLQCVELGRRD